VPYARDVQPYVPPVRLQAQLGARVTVQQLELLARGLLQQVVTRGAGEQAREYFRWDNDRRWSGFGTRPAGPAAFDQRE
jgi:hypothetical protein